MSATDFDAVFAARWAAGPRGFALMAGGDVVGALATVRATRATSRGVRDVCNLSSFGVAPAFRSYGAALLSRAVADRSVVYTNFTASAAVVELLRAFGFVALNARERFLLPLAGRSRRATLVTGDAVAAFVEADPSAARAVVDHRGTRTKWVGVEIDGERCAVALHVMRARGIRFAHVLYCSAPERFAASIGPVRHACRRTWDVGLLAWPEWQFAAGGASFAVTRPRPVMVRGEGIRPADVDGLYSELALLPIDA